MQTSHKVELPATTKTYSTHNRAATFGYCRDPAPVDTPNGQRWVAQPFWKPDGSINLYSLAPK